MHRPPKYYLFNTTTQHCHNPEPKYSIFVFNFPLINIVTSSLNATAVVFSIYVAGMPHIRPKSSQSVTPG